MTFTSHPFELNQFGDLCHFLGDARQDIERCHYLHPGDLTWQVFHMLAAHAPETLIRLWRDEHDVLAGFVLIYPDFGMFDIQVHPKFRSASLENDMVQWAQGQMTTLNPHVSGFYTLVNEQDEIRSTLLKAQGYTPQGDWLYMQHPGGLLPDAPTISGFSIADMTQVDPDQRAKALADAFGGTTRPEHYRRLMAAPSYDPKLDLVAVTENGEAAAFAMCWIDSVSKTGQFEPVGTVSEYRQRGLGKVTLLEGLRRMHTQGMQKVIVIVEAEEDSAVHLYTSIGFTPRWKIILYGKTAA